MYALKRFALFLTFGATLGLGGCGDTDNPFNPIPTGTLRVANAISDSQPIDAAIEGIPDNIENIAFGTASGERDIPEGNYRVTLSSDFNSSQVSIADDHVDVDDGQVTFVYGVGRMADSTRSVYVVEAPDNDIANNQSEVQFVDVASQTSQALDVYVTAPADTLIGATPKATLTFKSASAQFIYTPGNYRIRITPQGDLTTVLFDSGPAGVSFPPASTQQFAIADHVGGASPLFLMVLAGDGSNHQIQHLGS